MPDEIRQSLKGRGIASTLIDMQLLGWNGKQIVIPFFGETRREVLGFRYATWPQDTSAKPVITSDESVQSELYGRETLARTPHRVVICEKEFDRLVLESRGFAAVAVTSAFLPEWTPLFNGIDDVFICFNRSVESDRAARKIQDILSNANMARLPADVGNGGSISDFFLHLLRSNHDFEIVLAGSVSSLGVPASLPPELKAFRPHNKSQQRRAEAIKKRVRLHDVAFTYMNLQAAAGRLVGHCPFHDDSSRSFSVYPETDTYRCGVCAAEGDVVRFLVDKESMTFGQALEALEGFEITHELYPS